MQIRNYIKWIVMTLSPLLCVACDNNVIGTTPPQPCCTYIQFVSPVGTNVLDSINVIPEGESCIDPNPDLIAIVGKQEQDVTPLDMTNSVYREIPGVGDEFKNKGTLLCMAWNDWFYIGNERHKSYNDSYEINMRSPRVFGDDKNHTLKWYVRVMGFEYDAYKCEYDGKEVFISDDPLYNTRNYNGRHWATAVVTVVCE